jgi:peptide chain release factor 1
VEIRGAEGGEEANLFARDLFDMYNAYAVRNGWSVEVLSLDTSPMGGINQATMVMKGDSVWTKLRFEGGPHRVQRVPVTESQGRIHTSSATVLVLPEAEEVDVQIDEKDLQIDVYRASGPGGQGVNTTDSAVRITHKPTGLVVAMQDERSQLQNRLRAMTVLRARLLKLREDEQAEKMSAERRAQVGKGGRGEKIRTYNFKENRITDHRIGFTLYQLQNALAGDLDPVIDALTAQYQIEQLAHASSV